VFGYTSSPAVGQELMDIVADTKPDVVVIDCMFSAALEVAPRLACPTVVMIHTFLDRIIEAWRSNISMQSESRQRAGFAPLPDLNTLWGQRDLIHVNALKAFETDPANPWHNVVHGAPVLTAERRAVRVELPWTRDDPTPLVLLSFSTVTEQRNLDMLQCALNALGPLPVHVVATTGGTIDPADLDAPPNTHLETFADHDALMDQASFVVGHGGHGTTMRALKHGLPMVGIPAKGSDQLPITQLMEEWKVGRALPGDADVEQIRNAAEEILADHTYKERAELRALAFIGLDGPQLAADSVEHVIGARAAT
jgi:UDP:flavonoid glycosyltransferase YjiC (YdhE family)